MPDILREPAVGGRQFDDADHHELASLDPTESLAGVILVYATAFAVKDPEPQACFEAHSQLTEEPAPPNRHIGWRVPGYLMGRER